MAGDGALGGPGGPAEAAGHVVPGTELAGYRIEALLGRGGMGVVYRAHDLALDRNVALKLLAPELAEDVRFRERFLRESRLAASLDHPAIIPIYDAGGVGGHLYIAMRLVDGTDLKRLLAEEGVLEPDRALALVEQIADALDAAHERGLVHRDVKPSNVLVDARGHCYLADFGLSRRLADQAPAAAAGRSLGTVDYVAPEQIRGDELDGRADLYSLGCMLYECLTGRPPFAGRSDTAVVFAHLETAPPVLPGLEPVLAKALAKEPADRYGSGRELVAAAREALRPPERSRRRRIAAAMLAVAAVIAAVVAVVVMRSPAPTRVVPVGESIALEPNGLSLVDARTRRVTGKVGGERHVTHGATDLAFSGRSAWLVVGGENRLLRVDTTTHRVTRAVELPWTPTERIAVGGGMVWVREARNLGQALLGVDVRTGRIARRFEQLGGSSIGIAYGYGSLWVVGGGNVLRVDPATGKVLHQVEVNADWLTIGTGAVWAASSGGLVWKIDPVENRTVAVGKLHGYLSDLAVGGGFVWVSIVGDEVVFKLSEDDLSVQRAIPSGPDPERLFVGGGSVWVANTAARTVSLLDPVSGARRQLSATADPLAVRVHDGLAWIPAARSPAPLPPASGQELRISTPYHLMSPDPVQRVFPMDEQLSYATCATLLAYPDSAGPAGTRLRPEVAAAMPTISPDGRTYTFRIRRGFRFAPPSNEAVTAETFRHTLERTLYRTSQGWPDHYLPDIVGAEAYSAGKAARISGISAHGRTLAITLVRPSGDFLARLQLPVFCPVPLSTPLDPQRTRQPIPSDGPYSIASVEPHRVVLLRNPNYTGRRPRRPARIVVTDNIPTQNAVALVDRGLIDYLPPDFSGGLLGPNGPVDERNGPASTLAGTSRQRFFLHPRPLLDTIVFNTRRPLFRNVRLRRAVAYALDRRAMAKAYSDAPASQLVPAAVPGYGAGRVYPLGPDLQTARRLAGPAHRHAVLLAPCHADVAAAASILRTSLARIGISSTIVNSGACGDDVAAAFAHADLMIGTDLWRGPSERDPEPFFDDVLAKGASGSPLGPGPWHGSAFRGRLEGARALRGEARVAAYARLDAELARMAPLAVYGAFLYDEYFSKRVGCKLFQSFYGVVDLGALCVGKP